MALHKVTRRESSSVGESNTFVLYSDDLGCSWEMAEPQLVVPSPLGGGGACEPTVIELMVNSQIGKLCTLIHTMFNSVICF